MKLRKLYRIEQRKLMRIKRALIREMRKGGKGVCVKLLRKHYRKAKKRVMKLKVKPMKKAC